MTEPTLDDILLPTPSIRSLQEPASVPDRDPEWLRFDADIRRALANLRERAEAAISAGEAPPKLDVKAIAAEAGRSRSQLYAAHKELLEVIGEASRDLARLTEEAAERARVAAKRPTINSQQAEITRLKREFATERAVNSSKLAGEIYAKLFTRDGELLRNRIVQLEQAGRAKDEVIANLRGLVAALQSAATQFHAPISKIIDVELEPNQY